MKSCPSVDACSVDDFLLRINSSIAETTKGTIIIAVKNLTINGPSITSSTICEKLPLLSIKPKS